MMRAIVQEGYGSPDVLRLRDIDKPVAADDGVLVRVRAASVNAADAHLVHGGPVLGSLLRLRTKNRVRGFDLAGVVEAVGRNVTRFKPGDEVFGTAQGSFAEYASTSENHLAAKPARLSFQLAAAVPLAGMTALQGLRDKGRLQPGQRVVIHGAGGGVGTFAVQVARALGAHVTAVTSPRNMDVVRSLNPDVIIDYTRVDFLDQRERYDVFFDIAATRSPAECRRVLTPRGAWVRAGAPKGSMLRILSEYLTSMALAAVTSQRFVTFLSRSRGEDLVELRALIEDGKVSPVIDREYSLPQVPEAVGYVKSGQAIAKVVINID